MTFSDYRVLKRRLIELRFLDRYTPLILKLFIHVIINTSLARHTDKKVQSQYIKRINYEKITIHSLCWLSASRRLAEFEENKMQTQSELKFNTEASEIQIRSDGCSHATIIE